MLEWRVILVEAVFNVTGLFVFLFLCGFFVAFTAGNFIWECKFMNWIQSCPLVLLIPDAQ